jgi:hypothetical protein
MAFVDDRGRLFGRINLIDALVGGLAIAIIPLAYAGYALFRQPQPTLVGVEPATLTPTTTHVTVRGQNLRPFLRVSFDQRQGVTFALSTPTTAEVKLPELPAGKYDLILYDVAREVSRLPGAVTVEAAPLPSAQASMLVSGAFVALDNGLEGLLHLVRMWPIDLDIADNYGNVYQELKKAGRALSQVDMVLAAMCRHANLTLLTTDQDFQALPDVQTENWLKKQIT